MNRTIKTIIPAEVIPRVVYKGTKLSSYFHTKDKTEKEHVNNIVYHIKCPDGTRSDTYIGEPRGEN